MELSRTMRITRHEHATIRVDAHGQTLVIDPGSFTAELPDLEHLVGVVITHEHADHWTPAHLDRLLAQAPGVPIFGPTGVVRAASAYPITEVSPGDEVRAGQFVLRFFGGVHEVIHSSIPVIDNVGVLVDDTFYYPGDSYARPEGVDVEVLAAPLGAPWLRVGDAIDFVLAVAPRYAFGTHDRTLSDAGAAMHHGRLTWATEQGGGHYYPLRVGEALEV